jgi:hypothetical protein
MNLIYFNKIYDEVISKIKLANTKKQFDIILNLPSKRFGYPDFSFKELLFFVINKLRNNGFHVRFMEPDILYISWINEEELLKKKQIDNFYQQEKQITKSILPK